MLITQIVSFWGKGGVEKFIETFPARSQQLVIGSDLKAISKINYADKKNIYFFHSPPYFLTISYLILTGRGSKVGIFIHNDLENLYSLFKKLIIYPWLAVISLFHVKIIYLSSCNNFLSKFCSNSVKLGYISNNTEFNVIKPIERKRIVFVSRYAKDKCLGRAVSLVQSLNDPEVILEVWGDGYEDVKSRFKDQVNIKFYGFTDDISKIYHHKKILLISSKFESGPLTAIEALQKRMPVVSTKVGIFKNYNEAIQSGFRVYKDDEEAKRCLLYFLNDQKHEEDPRDFLQTITYNDSDFYELLLKHFKNT